MGWEKSLLPRGVKIMDFLEKVPGAALPLTDKALEWGPDGAREGSPNHEAESWSCRMARVAVERKVGAGRAEDYADAKNTLMTAYFPREMARGPKGVGLWASEQLCSSAHDGQHLAGTSMSRVAAWESQDKDLLAATEELILTTVRALLCVSVPGPAVLTAGARTDVPNYSQSNAWLGVALGHKPTIGKKQIRDPFWLQTRALTYLAAGGDPLLKITANLTLKDAQPCTLKRPVDVYRTSPSDYLVVIPGPTPMPGPVCDWALIQGGKLVDYSNNWEKPVPESMRNGTLTHFPGIGS